MLVGSGAAPDHAACLVGRTTTLFAALNMAAGKVSGACFSQYGHQEFLRFLHQIDREYEPEFELAVRRGSFASVPDLIEAIAPFIRQWNRNPQPFVWRARAERILEKLERARRRLEQIKPGSAVRRSH